MDNPFLVKLADVCAQAAGDEESRKKALEKCTSFGLSEREEFLLAAIFGPTPDNVLDFISLYEIYLPYIRGNTRSGSEISNWESANKIDLATLDLESVETFGWLLRLVFLWNGEAKYEPAIRELVRKFDAYTNGNFAFDNLSEEWSEIYYKLILVLLAENLPFLEKPVQMFFVGSKMFFDALMFGVDLDDKINRSVDYYVYLSIRFDQSTDFATFLYANEQNMGFDPETGEPVGLSYWVDKFRIYSDKKFDGLSLINFIQDEKSWGAYNGSFVRMIIKSTLMIYGHLVSGYYIYPPADELEQYTKSKKTINLDPVVVEAPVAPVITVPVPVEPTQPSGTEIKEMVQNKTSQFSDDEKPAAVINLLNELSEEYGDSAVADLYYFDEQSGEFKWRE